MSDIKELAVYLSQVSLETMSAMKSYWLIDNLMEGEHVKQLIHHAPKVDTDTMIFISHTKAADVYFPSA